jgi:hypothetical protein
MNNQSENEFPHRLEGEIKTELAIAESSHPEDVFDTPVTEWLFDPTDSERYEVGLHGLLDAVEAVEDATSPNAEQGHS